MNTVLLTGFEPFGGEPVNPSAEIVLQLDGTIVAGHTVAGAVLPCVFGAATLSLREWMRTRRPTLVIAVGLAGGRSAITPERVAINVADARIPDNAGQQPVDEPVVRGGPAAYWSTLPIKAIVAALRAQRIPADVSQTAGTFVCNHVFYGLMHSLSRSRREIRGGFIHVPPLAEGGRPGLTLAQMTEGLRIAIETSLTVQRDLPMVSGAEA